MSQRWLMLSSTSCRDVFRGIHCPFHAWNCGSAVPVNDVPANCPTYLQKSQEYPHDLQILRRPFEDAALERTKTVTLSLIPRRGSSTRSKPGPNLTCKLLKASIVMPAKRCAGSYSWAMCFTRCIRSLGSARQARCGRLGGGIFSLGVHSTSNILKRRVSPLACGAALIFGTEPNVPWFNQAHTPCGDKPIP